MWNVVTRMQLNQVVERILHVPGNYVGGPLEMTIVWDYGMDAAEAKEVIQNVAQALKAHSEVFRNVRVNVVHWKSDTRIQNEVVPLMRLTMDSYYEKPDNLEQVVEEKQLVCLTEYLKKFHARSKLILLVTNGNYLSPCIQEEQQRLKKSMEPFLEKKIARIFCAEEAVSIGYRNWWKPIE